ncbi:MAG: DUF2807 domain-containing protein [Bacteroidales bacterium]|nr:DUF2807 domain-containing protein [Bacteroidales bacterium]
MKKLLSVIIVVLAAAVALNATEPEKINYVTNTYAFKDFNGLDVSSVTDVRLRKSNNYSVQVSVPDVLEKYLVVKVEDSELKIGLKNAPSNIMRRLGSWSIIADITMPELRSLEMSGASKFTCPDAFNIGQKTFDLELSGASKISNLRFSAAKFNAEVSGASSLSITANTSVANMEISGASKGNFKINAHKLNLETSGASKFNFTGEYKTFKLDASGACSLVLSGKTDVLDADISGASKLDAEDLYANNVSIDLSGASKASVFAADTIDIDSSGASNLTYRTPEGRNIGVNLHEVSKSSSVRKAN